MQAAELKYKIPVDKGQKLYLPKGKPATTKLNTQLGQSLLVVEFQFQDSKFVTYP